MPRASAAMSRAFSAYARQFLELMQKPDVEFDRGPVAGDLDRAEDDLAQPALDGRHGDRDLRLHAAALGAGRGAVFAGDRPADRQPDRLADGRPRAGDAGGHEALSAGPGRPPPQGRVPQGTRRLPEARVSAGQGRRQDVRGRRGPGRSRRTSRTTSRSSSTGWWSGRSSATGSPIRSRPRSAWPTGIAITENADSGEETIFSAKFACPVSGFTIPEIEPRLFSFNNPFGACPACDGLGTKLYFDPDLVVHDHGRTPRRGRGQPVVAFVARPITRRR